MTTTRLMLRWSGQDHDALLDVDLLRCSFTLSLTSDGKARSLTEDQLLSNSQEDFL